MAVIVAACLTAKQSNVIREDMRVSLSIVAYSQERVNTMGNAQEAMRKAGLPYPDASLIQSYRNSAVKYQALAEAERAALKAAPICKDSP